MKREQAYQSGLLSICARLIRKYVTAPLSGAFEDGGMRVVRTENLASWLNIVALVLSWQPFLTTNLFG